MEKLKEGMNEVIRSGASFFKDSSRAGHHHHRPPKSEKEVPYSERVQEFEKRAVR